MSNSFLLKDLTTKVENLKSSVGELKIEDAKQATILTNIVECMSELLNEVKLIKEDTDANIKDMQELESRIDQVEECIEDMENFDEDGVSGINCPHCGEEVEIDEDFLTAEDPKLICQSCKKEIEVLSSSCGCGCGDEDEDGCDCEDGCGCGDDCECDDDCGEGCGCDDSKK